MKVLVCTDFSAAALAGERFAAKWFPDAVLVLFHAIDPRLVEAIETFASRGGDGARGVIFTHADQQLNEMVERLTSEGRKAVAELIDGDPVEAALAAARKHGVDAIVAGVTRGVALGGFRTVIARRAARPVFLIPAE